MQCHCKQAPEAAAMLLIKCGVSAAQNLQDTKAKSNSLEACVSILHTYASEGPDCAHEVALMCREVSSPAASMQMAVVTGKMGWHCIQLRLCQQRRHKQPRKLPIDSLHQHMHTTLQAHAVAVATSRRC